MMVTLSYIIIFLLLSAIIFFLVRTAIIAFTMLTEVPYLPSNRFFKEAIGLLDVKDGEKVVDIGSGDGRVLIYASKKYPNSQFVGIERNLLLVIYSKFLKTLLNRENLQFKHANAHSFNFSDIDKIYMYLLPKIVDDILLKKQKGLKKGCTVVSLHYQLGEKFSTINNTTKYPVKYKNREENIYKWIKNDNIRR
jgi:precorrin-6B methylase 2